MNDLTGQDLNRIYPNLSERIKFLVDGNYDYDTLTSSQKELLILTFLQETDYEDLYKIMESINLRRGMVDLFHVGINEDVMKFEIKQQVSWKFDDIFKELFLFHRQEYEHKIAEGLEEEYFG